MKAGGFSQEQAVAELSSIGVGIASNPEKLERYVGKAKAKISN
jgi:hypothetical protein